MVKILFMILKEWFEQVGLYPIPRTLSTSSVFKGWALVAIFIILNLINWIYFELVSWSISWFISESTIDSVSHTLISCYWKIFQYCMNRRNIKVVISGVNLKDPEIHEQLLNCFVISNHRSLFDYLLINYLRTLVERSTGEQLTLSFFSWNTFWSIPLRRLFKCIVKNDENWVMNKIQLKTEVNNLLTKNKFNWIVHFPEANIFEENVQIIHHYQAELNYLPQYKELLYPRLKNFTNFIESQKNNNHTSIKSLLDLTILYYHPIKETFINPTIFEIMTVKQPVLIVHIDFKLRPLSKLPTKPRRLERWLEEDWSEKDKMIDAIKTQLKMTR